MDSDRVSVFSPYQVDVLKNAAKGMSYLCILAAIFNSFWRLGEPLKLILSRNAAIAAAAVAFWICIRLLSSGRIFRAAHLFMATGCIIGTLVLFRTQGLFILNGVFLLAIFVLIGHIVLASRQAMLWSGISSILACAALLSRYHYSAIEGINSWHKLVGFLVYAVLIIAVFTIKGRSIADSHRSSYKEHKSIFQKLRDQNEQLEKCTVAQKINEQRYRTIFDSSPDFIYITDAAGTILDANPALLDMVDRTLDAIQGKNIWNYISADDSEQLNAAKTMMQNGRAICGFEIEVQVCEQRLRCYEINAIPMNENGRTERILNTARDITERKQTEAELNKRIEFEHMISEVSSAAVSSADVNAFQKESLKIMGELLDVNRIYIFEYDKNTDTLSNTFEWISPGTTPQQDNLQHISMREYTWWQDKMMNNNVINYKNIEDIPKEPERDMLLSQDIKSVLVVPLFVANSYYGFIGFDECRRHREWMENDVDVLRALSRIITGTIERSRAEQALRRSEENYRLLSETTSDIIMLHDGEGQVRYINNAGLRKMGYTKQEIIGQNIEKCIAEEHLAECIERRTSRVNGDRDTYHYELNFVDKNGTSIPFDVNSTPIYSHGQFNQILITARDISGRKKMEKQLVRQERLAAVGQMAAGLAHDFNNILTNILGYADMMKLSPNTSETMHQKLAHITSAGNQAAHLVQQLLDFSRKSYYQLTHLELDDFMSGFVENTLQTMPDNITLTLNIAAGDHIILADPVQIQHIVTNLVSNAKDAMPDGGFVRIEIALSTSPVEQNCLICDEIISGEWVKLSVQDTGTGISKEILPHIFEPFFTTKEVGTGVGLGLSQLFGITSQQGGHLTLKTTPGRGTTFSVYLPPLSRALENEKTSEINNKTSIKKGRWA